MRDGGVDTIVVIAHDVTALAAAKRGGRDRQPLEGRVPRDAVARAADAAQRRARLHADGARRRHPAGAPAGGAGDHRAQRQAAGAVDQRRPRRLAHHHRQAADRRPPGRSVARDQRGAGNGRRRRRRQRACALQSAIDQPGVPVAGDAQRLQQVIWNLLSNAIKFTPRGGRVQVRLAARQLSRRDHGQRHRRRHLAGVPAASLPALPPGRQRVHARRTAASVWGSRSAAISSRRMAAGSRREPGQGPAGRRFASSCR